MQISNNFFNSKIARNFAILLFFAASIPVALLTFLSNQKISEIVSNYEHKLLIETSRSYALSTLSNLTFARSIFEKNIKSRRAFEIENFKAKGTNDPIFNSIKAIIADGTILGDKQNISIPQNLLEHVFAAKLGQTRLLILPIENNKSTASINLVHLTNDKTIYIAELNANYVWGNTTDYPSDLSVCAYQLNENIKNKLFCSMEVNNTQAEIASPVNKGDWELFLAAEFQNDPWLFEIHRLNPITEAHIKEYIGTKAYISIGILCLLLVGLFTMIQIRRTMVPIEKLVDGAKNLTEGVFKTIEVNSNSEFSILATAFNDMSNHIKQQLETLQSYSTIDQEIISTVDVGRVIQLIINRMHEIKPDLIFLIANLEESTNNEVQSSCHVIGHAALSSVRLVMSHKELNEISRSAHGQFKTSSLSSPLIHQRIMAELGTNHIWVLPIFWQDETCAFLLVGSKTELDNKDRVWTEYRDLASRIGIVISAHKREQQLLTEAQYDSLTGLPNRILLQDRLKQAVDHCDRTGKPAWVIFIDLDRFKYVNDSYGHAVGDALLIEIGNRLKAMTRETDTVARFGGDEFVIVLSGDEGEDIQLNVLNRVMDEVTKPVSLYNRELINTCSIGIAIYPNDGKSPETLIKNADIAMYRAKELGRNNYQFFKQSLNDRAAKRMQMITLLRTAIANNDFTLHYQPKVDLKTGIIIGLEALIRWENEKLGKVSPAEFIPIAEEAGLINSIGEWVLKTACTKMVECQEAGDIELQISVNISAKQLIDSNFVNKVKNILIETGLKASNLELELTESILMDSDHNILSKLHEIKSLGIQLSIDDFGTGYSNLSYLHTLPFDTLKIDKAFTDTITSNRTKAPIVNTIINLAKNLDLKVIAEGVETQDQANYLKAHGCNQIQGYYFSKPLPYDETKKLLDSGRKLSLAKASKANAKPNTI